MGIKQLVIYTYSETPVKYLCECTWQCLQKHVLLALHFLSTVTKPVNITSFVKGHKHDTFLDNILVTATITTIQFQ